MEIGQVENVYLGRIIFTFNFIWEDISIIDSFEKVVTAYDYFIIIRWTMCMNNLQSVYKYFVFILLIFCFYILSYAVFVKSLKNNSANTGVTTAKQSVFNALIQQKCTCEKYIYHTINV